MAPPLMAYGDTECQRAGLENAPSRAGRIGTLLGGVELDFVLETGDRAVPIDDQSGDQQRAIDDALRAENDREICFRGGRRNDGPRAFEEYRIGWRRLPAHAPVTGNEALGKADEAGALDGRLRDGLFGQRDRLIWSRRKLDV